MFLRSTTACLVIALLVVHGMQGADHNPSNNPQNNVADYNPDFPRDSLGAPATLGPEAFAKNLAYALAAAPAPQAQPSSENTSDYLAKLTAANSALQALSLATPPATLPDSALDAHEQALEQFCLLSDPNAAPFFRYLQTPDRTSLTPEQWLKQQLQVLIRQTTYMTGSARLYIYHQDATVSPCALPAQYLIQVPHQEKIKEYLKSLTATLAYCGQKIHSITAINGSASVGMQHGFTPECHVCVEAKAQKDNR